MAATGTDVKQLQLQISASTELLVRNLKSAEAAVSGFRQKTESQLGSIEGSFGKLGGALSGVKGLLGGAAGGLLAAVGGVSLIQLAKEGLDYASSLAEVAQQSGVSAKSLQIYRYAASQVGIAQDDMDKGLAKLTQTMGKAELGAKGPASAFNAIGISLSDLKGKTAGDIIPKIADGLAKIESPAKRATIEVALFGKAIGGPISAGTPYLVGERGPEMIVPRVNGTVVPNHALMGGGGGTREILYLQVDKSALFDVHVQRAAAPLAQAAAVGGANMAQQQISEKRSQEMY